MDVDRVLFVLDCEGVCCAVTPEEGYGFVPIRLMLLMLSIPELLAALAG